MDGKKEKKKEKKEKKEKEKTAKPSKSISNGGEHDMSSHESSSSSLSTTSMDASFIDTGQLEIMLSNFDNVSLWDEEIKTKAKSTSSSEEQDARKPKTKKKLDDAAQQRLLRNQTFSGRPSGRFTRSNSDHNIQDRKGILLANQKPFSEWSKEDIEKFKEEQRTRYYAMENRRRGSSFEQDHHKKHISIASLNLQEIAALKKRGSVSMSWRPSVGSIPRVRRSYSIPMVTGTRFEDAKSRAHKNFNRGGHRQDLFNMYLKDDHVLLKIFSLLRTNDLLRVTIVCKRWNLVGNDLGLWMDIYAYYEYHMLSEKDRLKDINIWEDPDVPAPNTLAEVTNSRSEYRLEEIQNADVTLNQLVARITPNATVPDRSDIDAFLATYQTFTTPLHLIRKIIQRYRVPQKKFDTFEEKEEWEKSVVKTIQLRVCNILKCLITDHFGTLNDKSIQLIQLFIKSLPRTDRSYQNLSTLLAKKVLTDGVVPLAPPIPMIPNGPVTRITRNPDQADMSKSRGWWFFPKDKENAIEYRSRAIAENLTILEWKYFKSIKQHEFIAQAHTKPGEHEESAIKKMIDHFNAVSRWTEQSILKEEKCKNRAKVFEKFIHIARELKELQNYETLTAIVSALNSYSIVRLTHTKAAVNPKDMEVFEELHAFLSADQNYAKYREATEQVEPPCILYLGVLIRDLIYLEDTGATDLQRGHINFRKKKGVFKILELIQKHQSKDYNLEKIPSLYEKLQNLPKHSKEDREREAKELYEISLKREPRNAKRADID